MSNIFSNVINVSISASLLVLAVAVYRLIFRKAPKWINCVLWGIVALRLVIPVKISTVFGTVPNYRVFNMGETLQQTYISSGNYAIDDAVNGLKETYEVDKLILHDMDLLPMIWIIGMIVMLIFAVISYLNIAGKTRASVKSDDGYFVCDDISTPFILGFISPKIYIPSGIDKAFLNGVIAHEKAHIRRMDYIWKLLGYLILTVYWFNPVVWAAYILLSRDIEYACDEKVVKRMSKEEIADYSQALLNCCSSRRIISFCPVAFGNVGVKQRIKSVFNYKKPSFWIILIAVVASVSLIMVFATNQKETVEPDVLTADESTVYLDEESESEYGYYHCYYSFDLTGSNGIAKKNAKGDISVVIKPDYDLVLVISQNRFIVKRGSYSAMLDSNENEIIPFFRGEIRQINGMSGGKAKPILSVEPLEGTDYFTDTDGNKIIDREFLSTGFTEDGLFFGVTQDAYTFFDITGKVLCTVRDDETAVLSPLGHGFKRLVKKESTRFRYGVQAPDGSEIVPCEYDQVEMPLRDRIVARIGDWYGLDASDIARIFDETGRQITKDGDYSIITFRENPDYGIAAKFNIDSTAPDGYTVAEWFVNKDGEKVSDAFDSIDITDYGFMAKKENQTTQMNPDGSVIQTNNN